MCPSPALYADLTSGIHKKREGRTCIKCEVTLLAKIEKVLRKKPSNLHRQNLVFHVPKMCHLARCCGLSSIYLYRKYVDRALDERSLLAVAAVARA